MSNLSKLIIFFLVACCSFPLYSQSTINIDHYTKGYGLNYRWVYDIAQDDQGFMWFGTHTGLRRYDGIEFKTYVNSERDSNSISTNTIFQVTKDSDNSIWTYGYDKVLNKMDLVSGKFTQVKSFLKNGELTDMSQSDMKHFQALSNGDFIVMFQQNDPMNPKNTRSFWKYIRSKKVFEHQIDVPVKGGEINYFSESGTGKIWLWAMGEGYYFIDLSTKGIEHHEVKLSSTIPEFPIDNQNNFWYPNPNFKGGVAAEALKSFKLPKDLDISRIEKIKPDNLGNIWFYHGEADLYHFDTRTEALNKFVDPIFKLSRNVQLMFHIFEDQEGKYWNGHYFGAIRFTKQKTNRFQKYFDLSTSVDLPNNQFSPREVIAQSPTSLLVRESGNGLFSIDLVTQKTKQLLQKTPSGARSIQDVKALSYSMVLSSDGYLWSNQLDKLVKLNIETGVVTSFPIDISDASNNTLEDPLQKYWPRIFEDAAANLWWCGPEGIFLFDKSDKKLKPVQVEYPPLSVDADFKFASYDPVDDVIYGTYLKGIYMINCKSKSVSLLEVFTENEGYDVLITSILKWKNEFWLSTNKGLFKYDPKNKVHTNYTVKDGLASNLVYSALASDQHIWLATRNGLSQFDPSVMQVTNYYVEQGLPHNEFTVGVSLLSTEGEMFFGSQNGIIRFNPNDFEFSSQENGKFNMVDVIKHNQDQVTITNVQNLPYTVPDKLVIGAKERTVTFKYMLAMYDNANTNQYFHYLEGLDHDWISDGLQNEVSYLQIPPGTYTFRAKAKGPHNIPGMNEIAIPIFVKQYWYLRGWAIVFYILLITTAAFLFFRFQLQRKLDRQSVIALKELDLAKTKMYTNITHEFRTPLTVILGMSDTVNDYSNVDDIDKVLHANKMINRSGQKLLTLVNQILELSKLESGLLEIHYQQGNIVDYLKYRLEAFESYALEKGIKINFDAKKPVILMDYDIDKISYIVDNLLSNAIKFTPPNGQIFVDVDQQINTESGLFLELKVRDTGIGIDPSQQKQIFDRFYQVDNSMTRKVDGSGIGLSLVKELVKLLNGEIRVSSMLNEGTEFTLTFPITTDAAMDTAKEITGSNEWSGGLYDSVIDDEAYLKEDQNIPLVLIVEDNADVSHYIGVNIKEEYRIIIARNGEDGIEKAIDLIPDIIISDVMMPIMDGYELCETIKKDERTSHIPVILLTGKVDIDSKIEGLEHGADDYLTKPFNRKELLIRLKNLISLRTEIQKRYATLDFTIPVNVPATVENTFLLKIRATISEHLEEDDFDITQLCKLMYLSRAQLHRKLIALTGESTSALIRKVQLEKAKELLAAGELNVSEIAYQVGFKTQAHFSRVFADTFGIPPSNFRA